jgi:hypothetical protein
MCRGTVSFKTKLQIGRFKTVRQKYAQCMFKNFREDARYGYSPVICFVPMVTTCIFYKWKHETITELVWNKSMTQHCITQNGKSFGKDSRCI